mmetsp:Transcript_97187/g.173142  ORF Transcript_97187/g.173142 Transcript_97187/m.173142 type:complete len:730 (-) Transcript_97187:132-2321(-)
MVFFLSWLSRQLQFPGGLSQTDWWSLVTGAGGTGYAWWAYNQGAYCNSVGWRQNQTYQQKNYHLGWVAIARDDVRELMSTSVNRINNYMLIATLILGIATNSLFWVNNFATSCPAFVITYFWLTMGFSILFLSMAIIFGIKGQNSAFVNTMRLLTWEIRPENPAAYDHNYMSQVQRWERFGRFSSMLRMPGQSDRFGQQSDTQLSTGKGESLNEAESEKVEAPTKELVYLSRFAHFMRLWVPYELHARFCIGLGFISLSQGAAYFVLGALTSTDRGTFKFTLTTSMLIIFVFLTCLLIHQDTSVRYLLLKFGATTLLMVGPIASFVAQSLDPTNYWRKGLASVASLAHFLMYVAIEAVVRQSKHHLPKEATDLYVLGPHGQRFKGEDVCDAESEESSRHEGLLDKSPGGNSSPRKHGISTADTDAPTLEEERSEDREALEVLDTVVGTVRTALIVAASLWFFTFAATTLELWHFIGPSALPTVYVRQIPMTWPIENIQTRGLSCSGSDMFISTKFSIFRFSEETEEWNNVHCSREGPIIDIASTCDIRGRYCWPLALMHNNSDQDDTISSAKIVDCDTQEEIQLLQEEHPPRQFALRAVGGGRGNGTLLASHKDSIVHYHWSPDELGWVPIWEQATDEYSIRQMDIVGNYGIKFASLHIPDTGDDSNMSVVQIRDLNTGSEVGTWRIPGLTASIAGGCSFGGSILRIITDDQPPCLFELDIPGFHKSLQ